MRIYEYRRTMLHAKMLVVDGMWGAVGSMNADNRSMSFNEETVLMMLDAMVGATLERHFAEDIARSDEIDLAVFPTRGMGAHEGAWSTHRMTPALTLAPSFATRRFTTPFQHLFVLPMRRLPVAAFVIAVFVSACARAGHVSSEATPSSTAPRAIAVYRAVAESIYVGTTKRVVAVATTSLDSTCASVTCADLAARWGVETLWWARGDSSEARDARADLLARAAPPFDVHAVAAGQAMLLEADAGDVPSEGASVEEWIRFRASHADASGAVRLSPVGFSRSGRTAVTFVDWRCGPTCGHTLGVALTATSDSSWAIAEMLLVTSRNR